MLYKKTEKLTQETFENPGSKYRGTPFWAWNCRMDKENIDRTIKSLKEMGMGGGHIHCRTGMDHPYLGEEFLELVTYANKKLSENKMLTWLYDEDRWPSGAGGGLVTKNHAYRIRFLLFTPQRQEDNAVWEGEKSSNGQAVRSNERTLLARYQILLEDGWLKDYAVLKDLDTVKEGYREWFAYLEISGDNPWFNDQAYLNTLDSKAVQRFIEVTHETYAGILQEQFGRNVPSIFTDEPQFSHKECLDFAEQEKDVTIPFTDDLEETFFKVYGHSLLEHLPELFWELGEKEVSPIRYEYHDHIAERFSSAFADQIGGWCEKHGIALAGHMMEEPTLQSQTAALGEAMRSYRSFTIPGIDMLCDRRELNTAKQCQSAVHQYGREAMLSELYGVTNWDFDFRGHKLQGDWQAALGVTVRVPHLTWTSMEGEAKRDYPAAIGYQSPWYQEYPLLEDHFARLNTALTRGKPHVRVGVIHPIESYWLYWGPKEQTSGIREEMDANFRHMAEWLLYQTIDFDYLAESLLPSLTEQADEIEIGKDIEKKVEKKIEKDGTKLRVGAMAYDVILVPNCRTLRSTTLDILEKFAERGGSVIFTGELPFLENARPSDRGKRLAQRTRIVPFGRLQLLKALDEFRDVQIREADGTTSTNLICQMREEGENRWLFLAHVNRTENPENGIFEHRGLPARKRNADLPVREDLTITIRGEWKVTVYDTLAGTSYEIDHIWKNGNTRISYTMYDQDSLLLFLKAGAGEEDSVCSDADTVCDDTDAGSRGVDAEGTGADASRCTADAGCKTADEGDKGWENVRIPAENKVRFSEPNVSILDMAEYRFDNGKWQEAEEILRIDNLFRGRLGYPMRMEAFAQPWTRSTEEPFEHTLFLRYSLECGCTLEGCHLAMENGPDTRLLLDGEPVANKEDGWYTDHCIHTVPLPRLTEGLHVLQAEIPYNSRTNVENMFILGNFTVEVKGIRQILQKREDRIGFGDLTRQGYPFYGGNVTYEIPFVSDGSEYEVSATMFRSPLLSIAVDGKKVGRIAFSPYCCALGQVAVGEHVLEVTVYGNRVNTFGTVHNCNQTETWYGPNAWRTEAEEWSYEYQLKPAGLMKAPVLRKK